MKTMLPPRPRKVSKPVCAVIEISPDAPPMPPPRPGLFSNSAIHQAFAMYLPATIVFRMINFGRIILLTWFMSQQQFGLLTMILAVISVITPLCSLGLNEAVARYIPKHEKNGTLPGFVRQSFALLILVTSISVIIICAFARPLGDFFYAQFTNEQIRRLFSSDAPELARLSAAVTALLIVYFYLLAVFKGLRMFRALCVMEIFHGTLFLVLSVGAIFMGHLSAFTLAAAYGVALAIPITIFGSRFFRAIAVKTPVVDAAPALSQAVTRLLRFSLWTTLAGICWQILVYYPPWFLNKMHGQEAVAIFNAVRQIGQFVLVGAVAVVTVVMTQVTKTWEHRGRAAAQAQLSLAFRGTGIVLIVGCTFLALLKNYIMLMFKPAYFDGASILPLQLLFFLMGAYLAFLPIHFQLAEKTRHMFWLWAIGVATNVLYALWLAGPYQPQVLQWPLWRWTAAHFSWLFTAGYTGPRGLDASAWCGVLAIATSLICCLLLIRAECSRLDRGTYIIVAAAGLLALNPTLLATGCITLILISWRTQIVFAAHERRLMYDYVIKCLGHLLPPAIMKRVSNETR
jgi:O-antigen/teichoic acid export membrane protein